MGKTELLLEFGRDRRTLFFEATSGTRADHLRDFSDRLAEVTGRAGLTGPDWRTALDAVADWAASQGPVLLVLDEFQHVARESPDIGSVINIWWRELGRSASVFLVLSGSEVGFFEREVVNYSASAYGRRAGQLRLEPFRPADAGLFLPSWEPDERIRAYGAVQNPERSRQSFYRITDPYLRFWFRFVLPAQGRLADADGARRHLEGRVLPQLDDFVSSPAFEEVCQAWLRREIDAAAVGWWWGKVREMRGVGLRGVDRELDAVAIDDDGRVIAIGSCKWTDGEMPLAEKVKLEALAAHLCPDGNSPALFLFSRSGFEAPLLDAAGGPKLHLVAPDDM